jgi:hypothetical protein
MTTKHGVTSMTTSKVLMGTWLAVSLHQRNTTEEGIGMTEIFTTSSATEMHTVRLKPDDRSVSALNWSNVKKATMTTTIPIMTNLTDSVLPKGAQCRRSQGFFP